MSGVERLLYYPDRSDCPGADLAFEEEQLIYAAAGEPILVSCSWAAPVLVLGYSQEAGSVNLPACKRLGVPVLRRITGGTGVLHHQALSFSLALPRDHRWAASIAALYDGFAESLRLALSNAGHRLERGRGHGSEDGSRSPICFEDHLTESLLLQGKKVLGCAQARRRDAVLVHGTLLLGLDVPLQAAVFGVEAARINSAMAALSSPDKARLAENAAHSLAEGAGLKLEVATAPPVVPARYLARYSNARWAPLPLPRQTR